MRIERDEEDEDVRVRELTAARVRQRTAGTAAARGMGIVAGGGRRARRREGKARGLGREEEELEAPPAAAMFGRYALLVPSDLGRSPCNLYVCVCVDPLPSAETNPVLRVGDSFIHSILHPC